ncbi:MAG: hypothetical protein QNK30_04415, partial [Bacteroidales bacterium]|nr:hypothetical protein [Bacteroidales bacterium]
MYFFLYNILNLYGKYINLQREAELKEVTLQEKLKRSERMKALGLLAGGVAHDLNNMLSPVL